MDTQKLVVDLFGTAITYIASGVVWVTLLAGAYQLVRSGIRRASSAVSAATYTPRHYSDKANKATQHV